MGLAAAGYSGADFVEGFMAGGRGPPSVHIAGAE